MSSGDSRVFDLIERWEMARERGQSLTPDELCAECPELIPEVSRKIRALAATAWMEKPILPHQPPAEPQSRSVGRYELIELIGKGGFAEVWKARDPQIDRLVAIKLPRSDRTLLAESFLEEARKVGKLRHPGIVAIFDVGRTENQWFIVSELVESGSLATRIKSQRLTSNEAVEIVAKSAEALHHAHQHGFIHRDIKPQNILIDATGVPKVTDFGVALSESQPVVERSRSAGTVAYMSPEQCRNRLDEIDARTDVFSLGVVLYELLTGRHPFVAKDAAEMFANIDAMAPRPPRTIDRSVPVEVESLCLKAMAKKPQDRFSTAQDFADELRLALKPKAVGSWHVAAFALFLMLLLGSFGGGVWWLTNKPPTPSENLTATGTVLFDASHRQQRDEIVRKANADTDKATTSGLGQATKALIETKRVIADLQRTMADLPAISGTEKTEQEASAELAVQLGTKALTNGDMASAFTEFNRAVELNDRLAAAWHGRGVVHFNQGKYSEAVADLRKAISRESRKPEYFKNLAFALTKAGQHDDAVRQVVIGHSNTTLAERDQYKRFVAQVYDSRAAQRTKDGYHEGALADLDEAIRRDDSYPNAFDDRGSIRFNLKQYEEAVNDFTRAIELAPDRHEFHVHRGHALKALGRKAEADADYEMARRLESRSGR